MRRFATLCSLVATTSFALAEEHVEVTPAPTETPAAPDDAAPAPRAPAPVDPAMLQAMVAVQVAEQMAAQPATSGWKDGFFIKNADGTVKLKIGAFMQFDGRWFAGDSDGKHTDQFLIRTLRIDLQATAFKYFELRITPDFASSKLALQDAYADVVLADELKIRAGKFKEPFGMERLTSETQLLFAERGLPTLLTPNRDLGVQVYGELAAKRVGYQVGVFNGVPDNASTEGDEANDKDVVARVFVRPAHGLGIGGAVGYGKLAGSEGTPNVPVYRTAGQTTFFSLATGDTAEQMAMADGTHWRATGQASYYGGPFGVFGEYVRSTQHLALGGERIAHTAEAWQVAGQWVLTGEAATEKSVTPKHGFDPTKGHYGAVDLVARMGGLRVVDEDVFAMGFANPAKSARRALSGGLGLDWFANRSFRVAFNVEHTRFRGGAADGGNKEAETTLLGRVQAMF